MKKKLMALLLSLTMVVTLIPAMSLTAFAADEANGIVGTRMELVLDMGQTTYQVGESIKYYVFAKDYQGNPVDLVKGEDYVVEYSDGGEYRRLYSNTLPEGNYTLIARGLGHASRWTDPQGLSNTVNFTVTEKKVSPITIYAPTLWINTGDSIPDITYRYTVAGLAPGDDPDEVLNSLPKLRYASTPSSKKAGVYTITFRNYPDVNYHFRNKYYISAYVEGTLEVREAKSDNEKAFETYRAEKASDCDRLYVANDTAEIKNIAINAKSRILNCQFNKSWSLQRNCDVVYDIYNNAAKSIKKIRDDADAAKDAAQIKAIKPEIDDIDPIKRGAKIYFTKDTYHADDGEDVEMYQIARATKNGKFKVIRTVKNNKSYKRCFTVKVRKLKSGHYYRFKIRGVVELSNGKTVYTKWSKPDYVIAY